MSNSLIPLPADLPENWEFDNIIAPNGSDIGMPVQYGYNYVMQQLNNTQKALNGFSGDIGKDYQSLLAALALRYSKEEVDALLSQHNLAEASHPYILSLLANKVEKNSAIEVVLPIIDPRLVGIRDACMSKNELGEVFVRVSAFTAENVYLTPGLIEIIVLPKGFRPRVTFETIGMYRQINSNAIYSGMIAVNATDGRVFLSMAADAQYVRCIGFDLFFVAK